MRFKNLASVFVTLLSVSACSAPTKTLETSEKTILKSESSSKTDFGGVTNHNEVTTTTSTFVTQTQVTPPLYVWTELGPDSTVWVRAITEAAKCPKVKIDGRSEPMKERAAPDAQFGVRVCEAVTKTTTKLVEVDQKKIPIALAQVKKILVLGDTGCRISSHSKLGNTQSCNDADGWPFEKIAKLGAGWKPDLIIHVGDYIYRETSCPEGEAGCRNSPSGDNWTTWDTEFFKPARGLLDQAPWLFIRGNHELCRRAGNGWFRFLEPRSMPTVCSDFTPPYALQLGPVASVVMDTASAKDLEVDPVGKQAYEEQFKLIAQMKPYRWLFAHHPIWALARDTQTPTGINATLQAAFPENSTSPQWVISGHIHGFETLTFKGAGPSQLVVGSSGTETGHIPLTAKTAIAGRYPQNYRSYPSKGFTTIDLSKKDRFGEHWVVRVRNQNGGVVDAYKVTGTNIKPLSLTLTQ